MPFKDREKYNEFMRGYYREKNGVMPTVKQAIIEKKTEQELRTMFDSYIHLFLVKRCEDCLRARENVCEDVYMCHQCDESTRMLS